MNTSSFRVFCVLIIRLTEKYVEMIVLLHQQNPDDAIKSDLAPGELDATSAELKATHQEIKDYVLKELVHI